MIQIIGHRGAPLEEPENTIESFKKAISLGADYFECDVHLSKDEQMVVIHDNTLERTTDGTGLVKDFNLEELKKLATSGKYKIPTLEEVLKLNFPVIIELKAFNPLGKSYSSGDPNREIYPNLIKKVVRAVKNSKLKDVILVSFDKRYLIELNNYPEFKKMLLSRQFPDLNEVKTLNLFGLGVEYSALTEENVSGAHRNNLKLMAWTVDRRGDIERMIKLRIDFLASNDPKLAIEIVK